METWKNFFDLLMGGDYFILFIVVLMLIIVVLIVYLVKLQITANYNENEELEEFLQKKRPSVVQNSFNFEQQKSSVKSEQVFIEEKPIVQMNIEKKEEPVVNKINEIDNYELSQEESAIISTDELQNRLLQMKNIEKVDNQSVIDNYEEEQEKKAIISYEELLSRASKTVLSYQKEEIEGIKVNKVDIEDKDNPKPKVPYQYEEEFLRALKEFRASL